MGDIVTAMEERDKEEFSLLANAITMACDMLESFCMDFDGLFRKYAPEDYRVSMYDGILKVCGEAREQMRFFGEATDLTFQESFAVCADDVQELVRNKVRSMMKKDYEKRRRYGLDVLEKKEC